MLKIVVLILSVISFRGVFSQEVNRNLDLIIVIDGSISVGTISNIKIRVANNNSESIIWPEYYPGNLSIKQADYSKILSDTAKTVFLDFNYNEHVNNKQYTYHYTIDYKKSWLQETFVILRVYNLNKRKYKKEFKSIQTDKEYIFEIDSPGGTFRHVR